MVDGREFCATKMITFSETNIEWDEFNEICDNNDLFCQNFSLPVLPVKNTPLKRFSKLWNDVFGVQKFSQKTRPKSYTFLWI